MYGQIRGGAGVTAGAGPAFTGEASASASAGPGAARNGAGPFTSSPSRVTVAPETYKVLVVLVLAEMFLLLSGRFAFRNYHGG